MIRLFPLMMLICGAIDSIRNLPMTALFGPQLIFFFIFAAVLFLIPVALVSAELASKWTHKGGVYFWVSKAMGEQMGFVAIWLQWINTMVWYPTILSFIAGILAYLIDPNLATHKGYLVTVILLSFWLLTLLNLRGLKTSAQFAAICTFVGMVIPMVLIIALGAFWVFSGRPVQIHVSWHSVLPSLHHVHGWISLTAIMAAFLGMELATVHAPNVHKAQRTFPMALLASVSFILVTMILGSLAIAYVLPRDQISLVVGVMQAITDFLNSYHLHWMISIIAVMIFVGSLGSMINWIISPARGLLQAAELGYLPKFLQKTNKYGASSNMLLTQAVLVSFVCVAFLFMPSVNGSYWLLTDLSTELYLLMYLFMFVAAIVLKHRYERVEGSFVIPGKKMGTWIVCLCGLIGTGLSLVIGFFPPSGINVGGAHHYHVLFASGLLIMLAPVLFFFLYRYTVNKGVTKSV
jgi:glutamate:GABA antiporter